MHTGVVDSKKPILLLHWQSRKTLIVCYPILALSSFDGSVDLSLELLTMIITRHLLNASPMASVMLDPNSHGMKRCFQGYNVQLLSPLRRPPTTALLLEFEKSQRTVESKELVEEIKATRILDLPGLINDYYINILDWSPWGDEIAVALGNAVWTWNAKSCKAKMLTRIAQEEMISALAWHPIETKLAIGTVTGQVILLELKPDGTMKKRSLSSHRARVTALSWNGNGQVTSGGKDLGLLHHAINTKRGVQRQCTGHAQEICGLKWSNPATHLLATGGNDNRLFIWDPRKQSAPLWRGEEHCAAVRALAWAPHRRGLLASGGGTADRCIKLWDVAWPREHYDGKLKSIITRDTHSQVCSLLWSPQSLSVNRSELVSAHGFSENQCIRWRWPDMRMEAVLRGHTQRVLFMAGGKDGMVATASPDETMRLWKVFRDRPIGEKAPGNPFSLDESAFSI